MRDDLIVSVKKDVKRCWEPEYALQCEDVGEIGFVHLASRVQETKCRPSPDFRHTARGF